MTLVDVALAVAALACIAGWVHGRTRKRRPRRGGTIVVRITVDVSQAKAALEEVSRELGALAVAHARRIEAERCIEGPQP